MTAVDSMTGMRRSPPRAASPPRTEREPSMPGKPRPIRLQGAIWLAVGAANLGGSGRMALLARIAECGSITQAARALRMSYKAAWEAIDAMNNLAGEPLVERVTGGRGGGGTRLTGRGERLVRNFGIVEREHRRLLGELALQAEGIADDVVLIRSLAMRSSARNQFQCRVVAVRRGAVNDEIGLEIAGGHRLVATITHESTEALGLEVGAEAFALVKASAVVLVAGDRDARYSARNQLRGTISRILPGPVSSEVVIELPYAGSIAATLTSESCRSLELAVGAPCTAIFKASSVILAVPA